MRLWFFWSPQKSTIRNPTCQEIDLGIKNDDNAWKYWRSKVKDINIPSQVLQMDKFAMHYITKFGGNIWLI